MEHLELALFGGAFLLAKRIPQEVSTRSLAMTYVRDRLKRAEELFETPRQIGRRMSRLVRTPPPFDTEGVILRLALCWRYSGV